MQEEWEEVREGWCGCVVEVLQWGGGGWACFWRVGGEGGLKAWAGERSGCVCMEGVSSPAEVQKSRSNVPIQTTCSPRCSASAAA